MAVVVEEEAAGVPLGKGVVVTFDMSGGLGLWVEFFHTYTYVYVWERDKG